MGRTLKIGGGEVDTLIIELPDGEEITVRRTVNQQTAMLALGTVDRANIAGNPALFTENALRALCDAHALDGVAERLITAPGANFEAMQMAMLFLSYNDSGNAPGNSIAPS